MKATWTPELRTRAEAIAQGKGTYYTGKPCQLGNKAERLTSNGWCLCKACAAVRAEKARQRRAARKAGDV